MKAVVAPTYAYVKSRAGEADPPVSVALGKAVEVATSKYNYYYRRARRPPLGYAQRCAVAVLKAELEKMGYRASREEVEEAARRIWRMLAAWSKSPYTRYLKPKTHVVIFLKEGFAGALYAQPDFKDEYTGHFYEVKSFDVEREPRRHVYYQAGVFSLLGPLSLVYFSEDGGYYVLKEKAVPRDTGIIDDVVSFLEGRPEGSRVVDLEALKKEHPWVAYRKVNGDWVRA